MQIPLLQDIVIILGAAVLVTLVFQKIRLPTIVGFLITGIIAGPSAFSLVHATHEVEMMAEIGVILLLFIIGLEFSLKSLNRIRNIILFGGMFQVGLSILLTCIFMKALQFTWAESVFTGFLISLSSTAIGLKILNEQGELTAPHGRISLAILIFQDIIVIPMMLFTPMLTGESTDIGVQLLMLLVKGVFIIGFVYVSARFLVPRLLFLSARTKSNEVFILTIVVICFAVAWLTSSLGLSLALGAFMAGLTISESEYSHQATSNILPFREVFTSFFFISIGMLLDLDFLVNNLFTIISLTLLVLVMKAVVGAGAAFTLGYPVRTSVLTGFALLQVGEFAFILSETGRINGIFEGEIYQHFLAVSILTMTVSPFLFRFAPTIALAIAGKTRSPKRKKKEKAKSVDTVKKEDHIVIIGFGINGKNVARAAKYANIPYVIVELNADTVKEEKANGEPILYGDAVHSFLLAHVNINKARVVVIAISDPVSTKRIIATVREQSKIVHIIVRTRFINEMQENFQLGANEVIPEEFETSIEIFTRVLHKYLIPETQISDLVKEIRSGNYSMLRPTPQNLDLNQRHILQLPGVEITAVEVTKNEKSIINHSLEELHLRKSFGITIIAIKRGEHLNFSIDKNSVIENGDILYVFGKHEDILKFIKIVGG